MALLDRVEKLEYIVSNLNEEIGMLENSHISSKDIEKIVMKIDYLMGEVNTVESSLAYKTSFFVSDKPYFTDARKYFAENKNVIISNYTDEIKTVEFNKVKEKVDAYLDIVSEIHDKFSNMSNIEFLIEFTKNKYTNYYY